MRATDRVGDVDTLRLLGEGSRRKCYLLPSGDTCVKFYRRPADYTAKTTPSIRLHIWLARHVRTLNVSLQEWRYLQKLRLRLPADLLSVFPDSIEPVYSPVYGWGIIESLIVNHDGSPMRRVIAELGRLTDPSLRQRLLEETERLFENLAAWAVCFYDPPNVLVQWTSPRDFRLRIVDFEPSGRAAIPGLSLIKPYVRRKVRRRCARYLERLKTVYLAPPPHGADPQTARPV